MPELILNGCRTTPLAAYLKALGVFRLLAEQAEPGVKAFWSNDVFILDTNLDREKVLDFFVEEYSPTPIVSPWNGGSGFYEGDAKEGIEAIVSSNDDRFAIYREVIQRIRSWPEMPRTYDCIKDITNTLKDLIKMSSPGKKQTELETLLDRISSNLEPNNKVSNLQISDNLSLSELEKLSKNSEEKQTYKSLWAAVKKGRTACVRSSRGENKGDLLSLCRSRLPEEFISWIDASIAIKSDSTPSYNWILGAGGIEGRLDLSNNFMQRLSQLLIKGNPANTRNLLESAIFSTPSQGLQKASIGQFDPGRAGGFNQGNAIETKDFKINPWDFILMLEGTALMSGSVTRHKQAGAYGQAALPFLVDFTGVGFTSSSFSEKGRAEVWMPSWSNPTGFNEIRHLFAEGRSNVGRRPSRNGMDFARSVSTLGVDRGLDKFVRYALLKRRGDSYVALPAGTMPVKYKHEIRILDDLDPIIRKIDIFLKGFKNIPATFESAQKQIYTAMWYCCERPDSTRFSDLVQALGRFESLVAQRDRSKKPSLASPLSGLRPNWVLRCDDGRVEVRIAAALASIRAEKGVGMLRANLSGVDPNNPWKWAKGMGQKHWYGAGLTERMGAVLERRIIDKDKAGLDRLPLEAAVPIHPEDMIPFLHQETDDRKIEDLLWGFMLVDWNRSGVNEIWSQWRRPVENGPLPRSWSLLKLLFTPDTVGGKRLRPEPRITSLLKAARTAEACEIAARRLRTTDLKPRDVEYEEELNAGRLLAGLLVPVRPINVLERLVLQPDSTK